MTDPEEIIVPGLSKKIKLQVDKTSACVRNFPKCEAEIKCIFYKLSDRAVKYKAMIIINVGKTKNTF